MDQLSSSPHILKSDWFWYTVQNGYADETDYQLGDVSKFFFINILLFIKKSLLYLEHGKFCQHAKHNL